MTFHAPSPEVLDLGADEQAPEWHEHAEGCECGECTTSWHHYWAARLAQGQDGT